MEEGQPSQFVGQVPELSGFNKAVPPTTDPPVVAMVPAGREPSPPRSFGRLRTVVLAIFSLIVLSGGGTLVFAETGYLPGVSRLYRKSMLPLLWHGMVADPAVVLDQVSKAMLVTSAVQVKAQGEALTNGVSIPMEGKLEIRTDTALYAEAKVNMQSMQQKYGQAKLQSLFPAVADQGTVELYQETTKAPQGYLRSNLLLTSSTEDKAKWFAQDLDPQLGKSLDVTDLATLFLTLRSQALPGLSEAEQREALTLLRQSFQDKGVVQKSDQVLSAYTLTLDRAGLKKLISLPSIRALQNRDAFMAAFYTAVDEDVNPVMVQIDFWVGQYNHRLYAMEAKVESSTLRSQATFQFAYDSVVRTPPATADTVNNSSPSWWQAVGKLGQLLYVGGATSPANGLGSTPPVSTPTPTPTPSPTASAAALDVNAVRQKDINAWGKAMLTYLADPAHRPPPTSGGQVIHLDAANSPLAALDEFKGLNSKDADSRYYYGYLSDGRSYTFSCVVTDRLDASKVLNIYYVKDGSSGIR